MGSKNSTVIGYKYYIGMQMVLGYGPMDAILQINVDDRMAWDEGLVGSGTLTIDAKKLFGGVDREGGIAGDVDIAMGEATQLANPYLESILSPYEDDVPIPAFRGVVSAYLKQVYIGLNPYLKPWAWKVKRTVTGWNDGDIWYVAKADIDGDINPAHIVYECLTSRVIAGGWGMGYPTSSLDDAAFRAAADTLYAEGFGMSIQWLREETIEEFIKLVLGYIGGRTFVDQVTGLFVLKLIREDYDIPTIPLFDESNVLSLEKFERRGWGETTNEVTVTYTDRETGDGKPVTIQNIANINQQGRVISMSKDYSGITSPSLAARVCQRDLGVMSAPLASLSIVVNRLAWNLMPGEVFKFSWAEEELVELVFRVGDIDWGLLGEGQITVSAVEDHFTLPSGSYWEEQPPGWNDPSNPPEIDTITTEQDIMELPYYEWVMRVSDADRAYLTDDVGFVGTLEREPHGNAFWYGYNLYTAANNDPPPVVPPIENSTYDWEMDTSVSNHHDGSLTAGQTHTIKVEFQSGAGNTFLYFSVVSIGATGLYDITIKFYNYHTGPISEGGMSVGTDPAHTANVVAKNQPFYIELKNVASGAADYRLTWSITDY